MKDLEDGALHEIHLCRLVNRDSPGIRPHGLSLKLMAEELESCPDEANLVEIGSGRGARSLDSGEEVEGDVKQV